MNLPIKLLLTTITITLIVYSILATYSTTVTILPNHSPEQKANKVDLLQLSDEANYPSPIIHLQQIMTEAMFHSDTAIIDEKLLALEKYQVPKQVEMSVELKEVLSEIDRLEALLAN